MFKEHSCSICLRFVLPKCLILYFFRYDLEGCEQTIILDGVLDGQRRNVEPLKDLSTPVRLGLSRNIVGARLWNYALTEEQIIANMNIQSSNDSGMRLIFPLKTALLPM